MFDEFEEVILARYNEGKDKPADKYDRYFLAYLVGVMSMIITDKQMKESIAYHTRKLSN